MIEMNLIDWIEKNCQQCPRYYQHLCMICWFPPAGPESDRKVYATSDTCGPETCTLISYTVFEPSDIDTCFDSSITPLVID